MARRVVGNHWYKEAIVYALDVGLFLDGDGDGVGDFRGLIAGLDHLAALGVTCLWLLPFFPSPNRDNGYDVADHFGVDPRHGSLGWFAEFMRAANERGIRVLVDLVIHHTSDQHPWFQSARADRNSPYHAYYVWADDPPDDQASAFPGVVNSSWTYVPAVDRSYHHLFYDFEPDLNVANPAVREEIRLVMGFWLALGASGFRVDAASHLVVSLPGQGEGEPHALLRAMRDVPGARRGDGVLMGETDVPPEQLAAYFGGGNELHMLFNFLLDNYLFLAFARQQAEPIAHALRLLPARPRVGQWANFLRNLDELDLERLSEAEREAVYRAFAPEARMRVYGRGIRRRLAPMVGGDQRRLELAYSLLFTLPGTPVLSYGDEIGMGDDLALPERESVRTPMQWSAEANAGFSTAPPARLVKPVIADGPFAYQRVNVEAQRRDPGSLLNWMQRAIAVRKQCPEFGRGACEPVATDVPSVFAHRCEHAGGAVLAVHNLAGRPCTACLDLADAAGGLTELFGNRPDAPPPDRSGRVALDPYGYRWFRLDGARP